MSVKDLPSPEMMRKLLRYEPDTGKLFWLERTPDMFAGNGEIAYAACKSWNSRNSGREALSGLKGHGYKAGSIFGAYIYLHRAAWCVYYGKWPDGSIDHINGDKTDNRIVNFRDVTHRENIMNQKMKSTNTSGFGGVVWHKIANKWAAAIRIDGVKRHLGLFVEKQDAIDAVVSARSLAGYHPNHGRE